MHEQERADLGLKFHASMRIHSSYLLFVKEQDFSLLTDLDYLLFCLVDR